MKFKNGDRVKVLKSCYTGIVKGDIGTIGQLKPHGGMVSVEKSHYDHGRPTSLFFENHEVELVKEKSMSKNIAMIVNATGCTVVIGTAVHTVAKDHPNFEAIQEAYAAGDAEALETLISVRKTLENFAAGTNIRIVNGKLFYGDREMKTGLATRIIKLMQEGKDNFAKPLIAFMENVMLNPSFRAVEGLYEWLERSNLPITPDGCFIAWKMVDANFKDIRTRTFDNSPGKVVEIARNQVDENPDVTCSYGLHFCSNEYLDSGYSRDHNDRIVMVKVNPKDVGAFPHDYGISKGRCCRYEVLEEVTRADTKTKFQNLGSGVYRDKQKKVLKLDTRGERAEITLVFEDGTRQVTKNRLGDTTTFNQVGNTVTLLPSGRTINIA